MANRHKTQFAKGGGVAPKHDPDKDMYNAQTSKVMKEAKERKFGGAVSGSKGAARLDKRARGGRTGGSGKDMTKSPFSDAHLGK